MDPQAPTWGTRAGDNELAKSLLYPAAPEPVESSIQGEADPEANVDDVHTELVLAPEDFPTPQARHDPSRGAKDPSMHYQQHYLHVRKHYAFWRDNVVRLLAHKVCGSISMSDLFPMFLSVCYLLHRHKSPCICPMVELSSVTFEFRETSLEISSDCSSVLIWVPCLS